MALGTWWSGDPLPDLPPFPTFTARCSNDQQLIAQITQLPAAEIASRLQGGNIAYIAFLDTNAVAYGWLATRKGHVDEIHLLFYLPPGNTYLWDFQTLPAWRGRGVYTHFLQSIIRQERTRTERFWIMHVPDNIIAARAIRKAGFRFIAELAVRDGSACGIELFEMSAQSQAGANLLRLPVIIGESDS